MIAILFRETTFTLSQCMWSQSTNVTDGQTDGQTTYDNNTALRTYVLRAPKTVIKMLNWRIQQTLAWSSLSVKKYIQPCNMMLTSSSELPGFGMKYYASVLRKIGLQLQNRGPKWKSLDGKGRRRYFTSKQTRMNMKIFSAVKLAYIQSTKSATVQLNAVISVFLWSTTFLAFKLKSML